ncbi:MAG: hypothetical protein GXX96_31940 [Planctomycetaceae bacterium]|nr:hypothetical protein [Planctomycetaceae bacterium]
MPKTTTPRQQNAPEPDPLLPPWLQNDYFFNHLPEQHQQAIRQIIRPLYQRFVLQPTDHLESATGSSVIFLLWTELIKQAEIAVGPYSHSYDGSIEQLSRRILMNDLFLILGPKSQMSALLIRLRQLKPDPQDADPPSCFPFPPLTHDIGNLAPPLTNNPVA